jgi:acyl transferase domain-containing protein
MGCRLPGASNPDQLWELLCDERDMTREVPPDRYDIDELYAPEPTPGKVITRSAGFVDGVRLFDADFFGIDDEAAAWLDPQQRLLLMVVWEALEDAGIPPERIAGARAGVYVGYNRLDCKEEQMRRGLANMSPRIILNVGSLLAGRLAFAYDLRGPAIALDTACSSSLVGIHLACQSMRAGETSLAIVGGVNLKLVPHEDIAMAQIGMTARDGRCKFGDVRADGWVPSDAIGAVVLKPLDRARADGDRVRALVVGSAVSNDGSSSGAPLRPSVEGQVQTLRWAYEAAGVEPADVDWVEAHGTGTPLIDPIELAAFAEVFGPGRPAGRPLYVGSVKTNIGHSEAASGMPGLIKTVMGLEHRQLPPNLHFETPNPVIPWDELPIAVPTEATALPDHGRPLVAGLGGQGLSAVNAHLVLRQADAADAADDRPPARAGRAHVLVLSARHPDALAELARSYRAWLEPPGDGQKHELRDIVHSAARRRQHHAHRAAAIADSHESLVVALQRLASAAGGPAGRTELNVTGPAGPAGLDGLRSLAERYVAGETITDWGDTLEGGARYVPLPTYPWQLRSYWWDDAGRS